MFKKILLIGLFAALLPLFGAKPVPNKEEQVEDLTRADVITMFNQFNTDITEDIKNLDAVTFVYQMNANMINKWMKYYRFIEVDTEIDRSWYERAEKMLTYMGECKGYLTRFIRKAERDKSPQYQKVLANLNEAHRRFVELSKNPTPVDKDKLNKLRDEKAKWQAQKRREQP